MKKIFSLLAATLFSAALMAADFTPTSVYVAGDQTTLGSTWASKSQAANYFESGDTTVFSAYLCYQSQGTGTKQSWCGNAGSGSTDAPNSWVAMDCFKGKTAWGLGSVATVRSSRTYLFNVTNCSEVRILVDNTAANRELYLRAFQMHSGVVDPVATIEATNTVNGLTVLSINGMNVADTFQIKVTTNTNSNSNFYEIAFISAPAATDVATLRDITVAGQTIEGFRADSLSYSHPLQRAGQHHAGHLSSWYDNNRRHFR